MKSSANYQFLLAILFLFLYAGADTKRIAQADISVNKTSSSRAIEIIDSVTAQQMWEAFCDSIPPGVTNINVSYPTYWAPQQNGLYKNMPPINGVKMKDGFVLASGWAMDMVGPNELPNTQTNFGFPGDADLQNAVGTIVMDAVVFQVSFTTDATVKGFSFDFCFGTEEYPEYVGTQFNDVFLCLMNTQNICWDNQGNMICVNSVLFDVDNTDGHIDLEYDGFTAILRTSQVLTPGTYTLKFATGDVADPIFDCGVFLSNFRFDTSGTGTTPVVNIIEDQLFIIPEATPGGSTVGTIINLCKYGPISLLTMNNVPEFYLNGWDIVVSNGVVFNASVQDEYILTIKATLDTTWDGKPWIVHDTADMTIKLSDDNPWPQIDKAVIYDQDGNGIGDSICVDLQFDFPGAYTLSQADFSWPSGQINYSESIDNNNLYNNNTIAFYYAPGATAPVWTQGQSTISVTVDSLGQVSTHSDTLKDGIGPVLDEAFVVKRFTPMEDTFRVRISEPVDVSGIVGKSFILVNRPQKEIEIEPISGTVIDLGNESFIQFCIVDLLADAPAPGDSLKILHTGPVIDKKDNKAHEDNPPVPIVFIDGNLNSWPQISNAVIYDQNGNGIGDSICMTFDGTFIDSMSTKTADFSWPENQTNYSESIDESNQYNNHIIAFSYNPGTSAPLWTKGRSLITVTIDSLGEEISRTSELKDGIGPLLTEACVITRYVPDNDTFFVRITEPVNVSDIAGKSFILINRAQGKSIEIEPLGAVTSLGSESYIQFAITDLGADAPAPGDSLKILHTGSVIDKMNNNAHKDNTPVPIRFIDGNVPVKNAYYYDVNGDGIVDRVRAEFVDTVKNIDSITFNVTWTDIGVSANDVDATYESNEKKVVLLDLQNAFSSSEVRDKTSGDMSLALTFSATGSTATYPVTDKAAPVITRATYYLSKFITGKRAADSLIVLFSENLNSINSDRPFLLKTQQDDRYHFVLQKRGQSTNKASFTVTSIQGVNAPAEGDSIWINEHENVADNLSNPQTVEDNKRVELIIKTPPFELKAHVIGPNGPDDKAIPADLQINTSDIKEGTVIILEPDIFVPLNTLNKVSCNIRIFDPVGNVLSSCSGYDDNNSLIAMNPLQSGPNNRIVILWADKNLQRRDVGGGTYLGVIDIEYPDTRKSVEKVLIPIME